MTAKQDHIFQTLCGLLIKTDYVAQVSVVQLYFSLIFRASKRSKTILSGCYNEKQVFRQTDAEL